MNQEHKEQITTAMNEWIDKENPLRTQAALAQKASVSNTEISLIKDGNYFNGSYKGKKYPISDASFYKLAIALGISTGDEEVHWDTKNFIRIQQVCQAFRERKKVGMFDSEDSGVGKTYALEYYANFNDQVSYTKITRTMGVKDLLQKVAIGLKVEGVLKKPMGVRSLLEAIREKVVQPGYLLIFDELEYAKTAILHIIKEIVDFTYGRCGVIACGMRFEEMINRLAERQKFGFPQLKRRLSTNIIKLRPLQNTEKVEILSLHNIGNASAVKWFNRHVHDFQMMSDYVKDVMRFLSSNQGKEVTEQLLDSLFRAY